ncbi:hypothetical protein V6N13_064373 [Hibiscus sabdariffa]
MDGLNVGTIFPTLQSPRNNLVDNEKRINESGHLGNHGLAQSSFNLEVGNEIGLGGHSTDVHGHGVSIRSDSIPVYNNPIVMGLNLNGPENFCFPIMNQFAANGPRVDVSIGGANSLLADSSHNLSIKENIECSVKMVPDSFEGYGNLNEENGKDNSIALLLPLTSAPSNGLFQMEAEAVWDVSKLLEISFKGRREAVIKRHWGLLCMWDSDFFRVAYQFVLIVIFPLRNLRCGMVNVYGPDVHVEKSSFLAELLAFLKAWQILWCIRGDFNMFLDLEEKLGQSLNTSLIDIFKAFVFEAGVIDIPLQGKNRNIRIGGLIKGSKLVLKKWFGNSFQGTRKPIASLEKEIYEVERRLQCGNYAPDLPSMLVNLWQEYRREESSWLQKLRIR